MASSAPQRPRKAPVDHAGKAWVVYLGLGVACVGVLLAATDQFLGDETPQAAPTSVQGQPAPSGSASVPAPNAQPFTPEPSPAVAAGTVLAGGGRWSDAQDGFELAVTEIGVREAGLYAVLEAVNDRDEGVTVPPGNVQLTDPGGLIHSGDPFSEVSDWPDEVPAHSTIAATLYFEDPVRVGTGPMRLDTGHIFVSAPVPDLWNGLSITDIPFHG